MSSRYKPKKSRNDSRWKGFLIFISFASCAIVVHQVVQALWHSNQRKNVCERSAPLELTPGKLKTIEDQIQVGKPHCFHFNAVIDQLLDLETNVGIRIITPKGNSFLAQGTFQDRLNEDGEYLLQVNGIEASQNYKINISLTNSTQTSPQEESSPKRMFEKTMKAVKKLSGYKL